MLAGDQIRKVDGVAVGEDLAKAKRLILGDAGSFVELQLARGKRSALAKVRRGKMQSMALPVQGQGPVQSARASALPFTEQARRWLTRTFSEKGFRPP